MLGEYYCFSWASITAYCARVYCLPWASIIVFTERVLLIHLSENYCLFWASITAFLERVLLPIQSQYYCFSWASITADTERVLLPLQYIGALGSPNSPWSCEAWGARLPDERTSNDNTEVRRTPSSRHGPPSHTKETAALSADFQQQTADLWTEKMHSFRQRVGTIFLSNGMNKF